MKYFSTRNKNKLFSFKDAVTKGLADDGGLFMPEFIPSITNLNDIVKKDFPELAYEILKYFTAENIPDKQLKDICNEVFNFDAPLTQLDEHRYILELFHGPTLAFKDFGARFMSRVMGYFAANQNNKLNILVATSGDTGSAVASGFHNIEGINVFILYPANMVSKLQEKQLTTYGDNITALEINGTFDDCQTLVKKAFVDNDLKRELNITSANSINIARLLPQSIYYFYAFGKLVEKSLPLYFTVPSGNLGNLTAGLFAKIMGLPVTKFISALNRNKVFYDYLSSGIYTPTKANPTISNAMDVGDPSNLERINSLFNSDVSKIKTAINSSYFDDESTRECIREIYQKYGYIIDTHGAVGLLAENEYLQNVKSEYNSIILETASASKFNDIINNILNIDIKLPERLGNIVNKEKHTVKMNADYDELKDYLLLSRIL